MFDIERFLPLDEHRRRMDTLIRDVRSSERAVSVERIYVPGEIEHERRARRLVEGIPLPVALIDELNTIATTLGVAPIDG